MITKKVFEFIDKETNKKLYYSAYNEYEKIIKENNKYYAKVQCCRCGGNGKIAPFAHIAEGTCFKCSSTGYELMRLQTAVNKETIQNRINKNNQKDNNKEIRSLKFNDASLRRTLNMYGEDFYLILDTKENSTYSNKEKLKELGCKWNLFLEVWFNKEKEIEGFHNIKIHTRDYLTNDYILKIDKIKDIIDEYKKNINGGNS